MSGSKMVWPESVEFEPQSSASRTMLAIGKVIFDPAIVGDAAQASGPIRISGESVAMTKARGVGYSAKIAELLLGLAVIFCAPNAHAQISGPSVEPKGPAQAPPGLWSLTPKAPPQPPPGLWSITPKAPAQPRSGLWRIGPTAPAEGPSSLEDFQRCMLSADPWIARRDACVRVINDPAAPPERRASALNSRAGAANNQGSYADAIADTTKAIALVPMAANLYLQRAVAYRGAGQLAKALVDVDKAIELEPTYQFAHYVRGALNVGLKNDNAAVADFTKAIELNRTHPEAWAERGGAKFRLGDRSAARADLAHALGLMPSYEAYLYLGQISAAENAIQKAIDHYSRAIALQSLGHEAYYLRGREYLRLIKPDEAIRDLTKAIGISPTENSYVNRANSFLLKKQFKEALADAGKAIVLNPRSAYAYNARGLAYEGVGQKQMAISDYRTALSLDPTLGVARTNLTLLGVKP